MLLLLQFSINIFINTCTCFTLHTFIFHANTIKINLIICEQTFAKGNL